MHRFSSPVFYTIPIAMLATACSERVEFVGPTVPLELRQPGELPDREVAGLRDVALLLTDYAEATDCANGRIAAIDEILFTYEAAIEVTK